jgi:23S rRNA pseudouridine1911/1915/1917 synthase
VTSRDELSILYEDNHCLAVVKPPGLLTQGVPPGVPTLEAAVKAYIKERYHKPGNVYLGIPHRLDRPVSGVVLFARNSKAAARLAEQFQNRQVRKIYWAVVEGRVEPDQGEWRDWLLKVPEEARTVCVTEGTPGAKEALLRYRKLGEMLLSKQADVDLCGEAARPGPEEVSLLEIEPLTGRMHQIRVQAARRGWPVVGDVLYGARLPFGPPADLPRDRIIALHARSLTFLHPIRYEPITLTAPLPAVWYETFPGLAPLSEPP